MKPHFACLTVPEWMQCGLIHLTHSVLGFWLTLKAPLDLWCSQNDKPGSAPLGPALISPKPLSSILTRSTFSVHFDYDPQAHTFTGEEEGRTIYITQGHSCLCQAILSTARGSWISERFRHCAYKKSLREAICVAGGSPVQCGGCAVPNLLMFSTTCPVYIGAVLNLSVTLLFHCVFAVCLLCFCCVFAMFLFLVLPACCCSTRLFFPSSGSAVPRS